MRPTSATSTAIAVILLVSLPQAQSTTPGRPLTLISPEARRTIPSILLNNQELIPLNELAALFQLTVREDNLAGGLTISYRSGTIVVSPDRPFASVNGRIVALPSPIVRNAGRWLVPMDFVSRALAPIYDRRVELRRTSRLIVVGDVRVPRVVARVETAGPPSRATIEITPPANVTTDVSDNRALLRIEADVLDLTLPASGGGLIEQIRAGDQPNSLIVALGSGAGPSTAVVSTADEITRVTVDVPSRVTSAPEAAVPPRPATPPAELTASRGALQTIVIDPGHGGDDTGTRGAGSTEEKAVTLDVARKLKALVETRLGLRVVLTRDDDRAVTLDERAAIANNSKADLFLSLHVNGAPSASAAGVEVFSMHLDQDGEDRRRESDAQTVTLPVLGGGTREIEVIRWDLAQARHVAASTVLASLLEETLRERVEMSPRPLQQAQLRVLSSVNMPSALVEMGYMTNPNQEKLIASDPYRASVAQALYETIVQFRVYLERRRAR